MKKRTYFIGLIASVYFLLGLGTSAFADEMGLVDLLVKKTGVTTEQAEGGAGSIFKTAKQNMDKKDFSTVKAALPEIGSLMSAAPKLKKESSSMGGMSSMLGKNSGSLGKMAGLYDSFSKLGLSKDMVGQFMPLILDYAKSKGGDLVSGLLAKALK